MLLGLYRYLVGYVDVEITGRQPERLVNLAVDAEMDLWDLAWRQGRVRGRMQLPDFFAVRPLARRARCRVRTRGRHGLPFLIHRVMRRHGLLAGAGACLLLLLWLSSHIWVVEVRGTEYMDPRAVHTALARIGLRPGAWKFRISPSQIEQNLPDTLPQVSWAAVRLQGTRAVVEVLERYTLGPLPAIQQVDIVASRPCTVREVVVLTGRARVKPGEKVVPGQTLIEGGVYIRSNLAPPLPGQPRPEPDKFVRPTIARGRVRAVCQYVEETEIPLYTETRTPGEGTHHRATVRVAGREMVLWGRSGPPFPHYRESARQAKLPGWRNWTPTVELNWITAREEVVTRQPVPLETARQAARERLLERLFWHLKPPDTILSQAAEVLSQQADRARIRTVVETIEDIGQPVQR